MTKIVLEIPNCSKCPNHHSTVYPTGDSWERAYNWWCCHDQFKNFNEDESNINGGVVSGAKHIAGYVEWNDKISIPDWCPIKLDTNA